MSPGSPGDRMVKSELSPCTGSVAMRQLNLILKNGP